MVQSMTAFARQEAHGDWGSVCWEIRSVNARYLEVNLRLAEPFRELENHLRALLKKYFNRGKFDCALRYKVKEGAEGTQLKLNQSLAQQLLSISDDLVNFTTHPTQFDMTQLLQWPGLIECQEVDFKPIYQTTLQVFEQGLSDLQQMRQREGQALKTLIEQRLALMLQAVHQVQGRIPDILEELRQRLLSRLEVLQAEIDQTRLEQEIIYMAQKMDIAEEVDRLKTHVSEFQRILDTDDAMGRRLDFLTQEMNREANTIAAKSIDTNTSHSAVELKVNIEQIREQVQNIE